ncbi:response regulator transcription factor [bacterium SCSIO 12741]|nr:response regulator transcription factor [bacterium SCSIO 12741]
MKHNRILLVEDDVNLAYLLDEHLTENDFNTAVCPSGEKALNRIESEPFDLCILDVVLPDMDGISIAKSIRKNNPKIPFIFLTARNLKSDMLLGYEVGAEDYVTKPFDADVLLSKIHAIMKRCYRPSPAQEQPRLGPFCLEVSRRVLQTPHERVKLSTTECGLFELLMQANQNPVSREDLMKQVWGKSDFFVSKSLDVYLTRIRKIIRGFPDSIWKPFTDLATPSPGMISPEENA